jgi:hypothetical protein
MAIQIGSIEANIDVRKTATDAGYVAIGIAVLAFQQAQVRRRELQQRLGGTGGCLGSRGREAFGWAQDLGSQVKDRIEPVVVSVVDQVGLRVNRAA